MNCYECAKKGKAMPAVAICPDCNCGLCADHLGEAAAERARGSRSLYFHCSHDTWRSWDATQSRARA
jgi:hypothetical protein